MDLKVAVVLLTWQRIPLLNKTLDWLNRQTYKNFDVFVSNGNIKARTPVNRYVGYYSKLGLNVVAYHDGNKEGSFRRMHIGRDLYQDGYDVILFIDDDIAFNVKYVEKALSQYEPKSYKSAFAWRFIENGRDYYKFRLRVYDNLHRIHYCGTGVSMIDASFFKYDGIFKCPPEGKHIEDLWMSYYAQHHLKWKLAYMDVGRIKIGGGDGVALYRDIQKRAYDKADFLRDLVKRGWDVSY